VKRLAALAALVAGAMFSTACDDNGGSSAAPRGATTAATPPAAGATLAAVSGDGSLQVVSNAQGRGFTVVQDLLLGADDDRSTLQVYGVAGNRLARIPAGVITGGCGAADVLTNAGRVLFAEKIEHHPAAGIQPASNTRILFAFDAADGRRLWTRTLAENLPETGSCSSSGGGYLEGFTFTFDGRWAIYQPDLRHDPTHSIAIEVRTGTLYRKPGLYGALGNWVAVEALPRKEDGRPTRITLSLPGSWPALGVLTLGAGGMLTDLPDRDGAPARPGVQLSGAAITPDATTLIGHQKADPESTVAYALPGLNKLWSAPEEKGYADTLAGLSNSVALTATPVSDPDGTVLTARTATTGAMLWQQRLPTKGSVCMLTSTQLVVLTNNQYAFLDPQHNGQQISHQDATTTHSGDNGTACPAALSGGVSGVAVNDLDPTGGVQAHKTIVQLATP
jgi:hypothetical protein